MIDTRHAPPEDSWRDLEILQTVAPGRTWADPRTLEPVIWEQDGKEWELTVVSDGGELVWRRQRHFSRKQTTCERSKGHTAIMPRWPIPGQKIRENNRVIEVDGYMNVRCDDCGANLAVESWHATDEGKRLPPYARINVVIPKPEKAAS